MSEYFPCICINIVLYMYQSSDNGYQNQMHMAMGKTPVASYEVRVLSVSKLYLYFSSRPFGVSVIIFGRGRVSRDNFHLADRLCQMEKCIKDTCTPGEGCLPIRPDGKFMTTIFFF